MKKIKISIIAVIAIVMGIAGSAFNLANADQTKESANYSTIYELESGGNMLDRTDWIPSAVDLSCTTDHSSTPCRIQAEPDGNNPSQTSFDDILDGSNSFQKAYAEKVTYKP